MKKFFSFFALIVVLLLPVAAWAHGHGHVMGKVAAVATDHIEVTTADGKHVSVPLNEKTRVMRGSVKAAASDMSVGMRVSVHLAADGSAELVKLPSSSVKTKGAATH